MNTAKHVKTVTVTDPDTRGNVEVAIFKHPNGGVFGMDQSYIDQMFEDEEKVIIFDPFNKSDIELKGM
ncbi:hypothetical protein LCGC14_0501230 [marine sediment metagenome]|uniref:Uncharacterized protein n=1 Tax=marine sediment metagenome TaxID=412755 RepID=A0A0F9VCJ3_9ZZZZ